MQLETIHPLVKPGVINRFGLANRQTALPLPRQAADGFTARRKVIRFGANNVAGLKQSLRFAGKNGVFLSSEFGAAKEGGLGAVTEQIPTALSDPEFGGMDVRIVIPYLKPLIEEDKQKPSEAFRSTGKMVSIEGFDGEPAEFEVMEKRFNNTLVYALKSDAYFSHLKNLYSYTNAAIASDVLAQATAIFNKAAAAFLPELNASKPQPSEVTLTQFKGDTDFIITNDWPTATLQKDLPPDYTPARIFMLHNEHDKAMGLDDAVKSKLFPSREAIPPVVVEDGYYSPLSLGIKLADVVIGDPNYIRGLMTRMADTGVAWIKPLAEKARSGNTFAVHHDPGSHFDAVDNAVLKNNAGFSPLKFSPDTQTIVPAAQPQPVSPGFVGRIRQSVARVFQALARVIQGPAADNPGFIAKMRGAFARVFAGLAQVFAPKVADAVPARAQVVPTGKAEFERFKRDNKLALQHRYNLKPDPNAVVFSWVARFDPYQKGFFLVANTIKRHLVENPNAQLLIGGMMTGDRRTDTLITRFFETLSSDPALKGRVAFPGRIPANEVPMITAGSSFLILPSLYEPFGLSQLEAMRMGAIPIVHGVDGLLSSVLDPSVPPADADAATRAYYDQAKRPDAKYGQTGIMMDRIEDVNGYRIALGRYIQYEYLQHIAQSADSAKEAFLTLFGKAEKAADSNPYIEIEWILDQLKDPTSEINQKLPGHPFKGFVEDVLSNPKRHELNEGMFVGHDPKMPWGALMQVLNRQIETHQLNESVQSQLDQADRSLDQAFERAIALAKQPEKMAEVGINAMKYVNTEHRWARIAQDYKKAIEHATAINPRKPQHVAGQVA